MIIIIEEGIIKVNQTRVSQVLNALKDAPKSDKSEIVSKGFIIGRNALWGEEDSNPDNTNFKFVMSHHRAGGGVHRHFSHNLGDSNKSLFATSNIKKSMWKSVVAIQPTELLAPKISSSEYGSRGGIYLNDTSTIVKSSEDNFRFVTSRSLYTALNYIGTSKDGYEFIGINSLNPSFTCRYLWVNHLRVVEYYRYERSLYYENVETNLILSPDTKKLLLSQSFIGLSSILKKEDYKIIEGSLTKSLDDSCDYNDKD
jgi:hypothetical protein